MSQEKNEPKNPKINPPNPQPDIKIETDPDLGHFQPDSEEEKKEQKNKNADKPAPKPKKKQVKNDYDTEPGKDDVEFTAKLIEILKGSHHRLSALDMLALPFKGLGKAYDAGQKLGEATDNLDQKFDKLRDSASKKFDKLKGSFGKGTPAENVKPPLSVPKEAAPVIPQPVTETNTKAQEPEKPEFSAEDSQDLEKRQNNSNNLVP